METLVTTLAMIGASALYIGALWVLGQVFHTLGSRSIERERRAFCEQADSLYLQEQREKHGPITQLGDRHYH